MADFRIGIDEIEFAFQKHAGLKEPKYLVFCGNHIFHMELRNGTWKILGGVPEWIQNSEALLGHAIQKNHHNC
jgi:hypothetical protein